MVVKPFQGRIRISWIFHLPRLDWGIAISDFEKIALFDFEAFLGVFSPPKRPFFAVKAFLKIPYFLRKKKEKMKNFLRFFGKLLSSPEIFLDLLGPYSRSEIAFLEEKKRRKKFLQQVTPLVR